LAAEKAAKEKAEADAKAKAEADKLAAEKAEKEKNTITPKETEEGPSNVDRGDSKYKIPAALGANKYKESVKRADDLFKMKRWAEAKTAYEECLKYKENDPYALGKIADTEKLIKK
jgi:hypothetical protein